MYFVLRIIITLTLFLLFTSCENNKVIKSVYGVQNDTIVSIKKYDLKGRITFDRTTQIVSDINENIDLLTWITVKVFKDDIQTYEYYGHSNSCLIVEHFEYNDKFNLINKYSRFFVYNDGAENKFKELHKIETSEELISYINNKIPDSIKYVSVKRNCLNDINQFNTYKDSEQNIIEEYSTYNGFEINSKTIKKYNSDGQIISKFFKNKWYTQEDNFFYDKSRNLIEELNVYDSNKNDFQRKIHFYSDGRLLKTMFYHNKDLAYIYEYFYENKLLIKEVCTEVENSKSRKQEEINYFYEYY